MKKKIYKNKTTSYFMYRIAVLEKEFFLTLQFCILSSWAKKDNCKIMIPVKKIKHRKILLLLLGAI